MTSILLVLTGGTIGSTVSDTIIHTADGVAARLVQRYTERFGEDVRFDAVQPFSMLSENSTPDSWTALCKAVAVLPTDKYDGVIVLHGSDTLSYASALLGFLFHDCPVPLLITAANYPPEDPHSNALENLRAAVRVILSEQVRGVLTVYQDTDGTRPVYLPTRLMEADGACDRFGTFGGVPLGSVRDEGFVPLTHPLNPTLAQLSACQTPALGAVAFDKPVLYLRPYPGLRYDCLQPSAYAAVLHGLYHSGTACTDSGVYSLSDFACRCREQGVPLYAAPVKYGAEKYAGSDRLWQAGAIPLYAQSADAAYVKLCIAYNQSVLPPEDYMRQTVYFEQLPTVIG